MKKIFALLLIALLVASVPVFAAQDDSIRVEYDGYGRVEVDFRKNVRYSDAKVEVKDPSGAVLPALIMDLDEDDLDFVVENLVPGETYSFSFTGVSYRASGETVPGGSFRVPGEGEVTIKKIDYDRDDRELEIEFVGRVEYADLIVTIEDANGKAYDANVCEKDRDSVELRVNGLERGTEYTVTVSGVRLPDSANTVSVTESFIA